jgi:hypothetical protein
VSSLRLFLGSRLLSINPNRPAPLSAKSARQIAGPHSQESLRGPKLRRRQAPEREGLAGGEPAHPGALLPSSTSWLNLIEIWFGIIERQAIRRGSFDSIPELMIKARAFIDGWNDRKHQSSGPKAQTRYSPKSTVKGPQHRDAGSGTGPAGCRNILSDGFRRRWAGSWPLVL